MKNYSFQFLDKFFHLRNNETTISIECIAGLTTFLTMAYIIFVNPAILADAGINLGAAFVATCLAAAIGSFLTGILSNYPMAVAPGMGLNAYFTYSVVKGMGFTWQIALGMVFISGILFLLLTVSKLRQTIIAAIPKSLVVGIAAGIGFFIGLIALKNTNIVVSNPDTLVSLGNINTLPVFLFFLGFILIIVLSYYRVIGAIILGILGITLLSLLLGINKFQGIISLPPSLAPTFMALNVSGAILQHGLTVIFAFFLIALFDSTGTIVGVLQGAQFNKDPKRLKKLSNALLADSVATIAGSVLGTSTTTPYVESAAGVKAGGRTGLTAVIVALFFLIALFFSPLAQTIPSYATAPALLYVACLMIQNIADMEWHDITEYVPGIITMIMIPFSFSIADGVGLGIISYILIKLLCGKAKNLNLMLIIMAIIFFIYFAII